MSLGVGRLHPGARRAEREPTSGTATGTAPLPASGPYIRALDPGRVPAPSPRPFRRLGPIGAEAGGARCRRGRDHVTLGAGLRCASGPAEGARVPVGVEASAPRPCAQKAPLPAVVGPRFASPPRPRVGPSVRGRRGAGPSVPESPEVRPRGGAGAAGRTGLGGPGLRGRGGSQRTGTPWPRPRPGIGLGPCAPRLGEPGPGRKGGQ